MSRLAFFALFVTAACVTAPQPAGEEFVWACPSGTFTTRSGRRFTFAFLANDVPDVIAEPDDSVEPEGAADVHPEAVEEPPART